jgi:5-(carboxyamino)imidazole ribonucleotide mutase
MQAIEILKGFEIEVDIVSAHRTPRNYSISVKCTRGSVIIAGAGGAAHLPGMVASMSPLPVIGVPETSNSIDGWDSTYRSYKCLESSWRL